MLNDNDEAVRALGAPFDIKSVVLVKGFQEKPVEGIWLKHLACCLVGTATVEANGQVFELEAGGEPVLIEAGSISAAGGPENLALVILSGK